MKENETNGGAESRPASEETSANTDFEQDFIKVCRNRQPPCTARKGYLCREKGPCGVA
jgi:hypothetical protein